MRIIRAGQMTDRSYTIFAEMADGRESVECVSVFDAVDKAREMNLKGRGVTQVRIVCKDYEGEGSPLVLCEEIFPIIEVTIIYKS